MPPTNEELKALIEALTAKVDLLQEKESELTTQISDFNQKEKALSVTVALFQAKELNRLKTEYDQLYISIREAVIRTVQIEHTVESTISNFKLSILSNDLVAINNPYNTAIGFNFIKIITDNVEKTLKEGIPIDEGNYPNKTKDRFMNIINKVVNNPITDVILHSNPIGAVVSNVINVASGFINAKINHADIDQNIGKVKSIVVQIDDLIIDKKIKDFKLNIEKYVNFYGSMSKISKEFQSKLELIENSSISIEKKYTDYAKKYMDELGIVPGPDCFVQIDTLFQRDTENKDINFYERILATEKVKKGAAFISDLDKAKKEAEKYREQFAEALNDFVTKYIKVLNEPIKMGWDDTEINKSQLSDTITRLSQNNKNLQEALEKNDSSIQYVTVVKVAKQDVAI